MVDAERLVAVLSRVTARLRILDEYAQQERDALLGDRVRLGDLKYTFQTAIEACIDAAHHVVADQGLGVPSSNADAFRLLGGAGIITAELAATMGASVGFRNVLVHGYAEVDDQKVVEHLQHREALRRYVAAMTALLDGADESRPN
jgi:uncharacterized protein YutE (UPF0331/DUF86 family)